MEVAGCLSRTCLRAVQLIWKMSWRRFQPWGGLPDLWSWKSFYSSQRFLRWLCDKEDYESDSFLVLFQETRGRQYVVVEEKKGTRVTQTWVWNLTRKFTNSVRWKHLVGSLSLSSLLCQMGARAPAPRSCWVLTRVAWESTRIVSGTKSTQHIHSGTHFSGMCNTFPETFTDSERGVSTVVSLT